MKCIMLLALLGTMLLPATAQAAYVTPEKQALLNQNGWTVTDGEAEEPYAPGDDLTKSCPHSRAKKISSRISNAYELQVRMSLRLKICANNGHLTYMRCGPVRYASPGNGWARIFGPHRWSGSWTDGAGCHVEFQWKFRGVIDQFWEGQLDLRAQVNHDHDIFFPLKRRIWR